VLTKDLWIPFNDQGNLGAGRARLGERGKETKKSDNFRLVLPAFPTAVFSALFDTLMLKTTLLKMCDCYTTVTVEKE